MRPKKGVCGYAGASLLLVGGDGLWRSRYLLFAMDSPSRMTNAWMSAAMVLYSAACSPPLKSPPGPQRLAVSGRLVAQPVMPRPGPPEQGYEPLATNASCAACHPQIARENRASFHGQAHADPVYQRALAIEPMPFCRACHAPEADPQSPVPTELGNLGVSCTSCHWSGGRVLAAPALAGRRADPHRGLNAPPVVRSKAFAQADACAGCHEFAFPDSRFRARPELMQSTISEHRKSPFAEVSCAGCHMPVRGRGAQGHRSHAFAASRDPKALRSTLEIEARRDEEGLVMAIAPGAVGHAMPTGDLFRRLRVEVEQGGADMNRISVQRRFLARHFQARPTAQSLRRSVVRDDRPGGADVGHERQELHFRFNDLAPQHILGWRVELERVLHPAAGGDAAAVVVDRQLIAQGRL